MAPIRNVPPLPDFLGPGDLFRLDGPADASSRSRLQALLGAVGTPAEWAAVGLPIRFDATGNPRGVRRGQLYYSFSLVTEEEAAGARRVGEAAGS